MTTFNTLPNEVQQLIIRQLDKPDIRECSLVCKSWTRIYQKLLYSAVSLETFSHTAKFLNTLKNNQLFGNLVNKLVLGHNIKYRDDNENSTIVELFSCLPNLEQIHWKCGYYMALLSDAIILNQLPRLNYIEPSCYNEEIPDYLTCALLLKDQLKSLTIPNPNDMLGGSVTVRYNRLLNILDQFKEMEEVYVENDSGSIIDLAEKITLNCPLLRHLNMDTTNNDDDRLIETSNIITSKLTHLEIGDDLNYSSHILNYIMQKFTHLTTLKIIGEEDQMTHADVDESTMKRFLNYLTEINHVDVQHIPCHEPSFVDSVGPFWKTLSKSRTLAVEFAYTDFDNGTLGININDEKCMYSGTYPIASMGSEHEIIIRKYGHYINDLTICNLEPFEISFSQRQSTNTLNSVPIFHIFKYCKQLREVSFESCNLNGFDLLHMIPVGNYVLNTLSFDNCTMGKSFALEELSKIITRVNHLNFTGTQFIDIAEDEVLLLTHINLAETDIDKLVITDSFYDRRHMVFVKLLIQQVCTYYMYDYKSMTDSLLKQVNSEVYYDNFNQHGNSTIDTISCKSLKSLEINHSIGSTERLNLTIS